MAKPCRLEIGLMSAVLVVIAAITLPSINDNRKRSNNPINAEDTLILRTQLNPNQMDTFRARINRLDIPARPKACKKAATQLGNVRSLPADSANRVFSRVLTSL